MIISTKYTHADLLSFPEDGKRREIIDGEMFVTPAPKLNHQRILVRLTEAILRHLSSHPVGELIVSPMDVIFSEFDILVPDLVFVLNEHKNILRDWVRGAPDLAIEILSPTTAARDRGVKLRTYARFGVKEYWIVDPEECAVEVYQLAQEGYELVRTFHQTDTLTSAILPEFALPVSAVVKI
jgi:Uma2 family endonuclease